jgi:hypothetical protein
LRFTAWDAFVFDARDGATLSSFLEKFRAAVGLEPSTVARGASLLFADFMNLAKPETAARMNTPLKTLFEDVLDEGFRRRADEERTQTRPGVGDGVRRKRRRRRDPGGVGADSVSARRTYHASIDDV